MLANLIVFLVDQCRRFAVAVIVGALLLLGFSGWYAVTHFKMNTDVNQLLADNLLWKKQEITLDQAFPQKLNRLVIVIDGATAAVAEDAAARLAAKLGAMPDLFHTVVRPDAIPFFRKNGLLFLPKEQLGATLDRMTQAQPMIGGMTTDPSVRGLMTTLQMMLQGVQYGAVDFAQLDHPLSAMATSFKAALDGQDKPLDMAALSGDPSQKPSLQETRKFILTQPALDFTSLQPGEKARTALRAAAHELNLDSAHGVTVRLTGYVALNDEEFASVATGTGTATIVSGVLVLVLLLMALRTPRIVLPILCTLIVGLATTTAFGLLVIGSLNLISVAFAVMFIGIGVDFGIQFGVRFRDQHHLEPDLAKAMTNTARVIAMPLSMAAASTALGFLTFIPTDYRGVSELGTIAGAGMIIAFMLNITLLPALLTLTKPPAEPESIGYACAAPIDDFLQRHRKPMLGLALILALAGSLLIVTGLRFDFDPLNLKDPTTESVSTLFDIMEDPNANPYVISILRPSMAEADKLVAQLDALPEVDHTLTLGSFVPSDMQAKLALIRDAKTVLAPSFALPVKAAPSEQEIYDSMSASAQLLASLGAAHESARQFAAVLNQIVARHDPALLARLQQNLVTAMVTQLGTLPRLLDAEPVTRESISDDLRRDWITQDGRVLVEVYPKGNARDHRVLNAFTEAVQHLAPDASGAPISIRESGNTVLSAFLHAAIYAVLAIGFVAFLVLRRFGDVLRLLAPLALAAILTLGTMVIIGLPLNFANIIALPMLLSLGVSYAIYFVSYWRSGMVNPLQSSMARAVLFSAATVLVAFASLMLSSHPGTSGMGKLLTVALLYCLLSAFIFLPCLLAYTKPDKHN